MNSLQWIREAIIETLPDPDEVYGGDECAMAIWKACQSDHSKVMLVIRADNIHVTQYSTKLNCTYDHAAPDSIRRAITVLKKALRSLYGP